MKLFILEIEGVEFLIKKYQSLATSDVMWISSRISPESYYHKNHKYLK